MKPILSILFIFVTSLEIFAQVGIGTSTPNTSSVLDLSSTDKGFLAPRMTQAQRDLISTPANGLLIYNTSTSKLNVYASGSWVEILSGSAGDNLGNHIATQNIVLESNYISGDGGNEGMKITSTGRVNFNTSLSTTGVYHFNDHIGVKGYLSLFDTLSSVDMEFDGGSNGVFNIRNTGIGGGRTVLGSTSAPNALTILNGGNVGLGTITPNAALQFSNALSNRKIVLFEAANNDHEVASFGINAGILRYQVPATSNEHSFYAATSSTTSNSIFRILGTGRVRIPQTSILDFDNGVSNKRLVLFEAAANDHEFNGFGINTGVFRYQSAATSNDHVFYAATSSTTSTELMRIKGTGNVGIGASSPLAGLHIDKGATNNLALLLSSSGPGWGSGMRFENTSGGKTYGLYAGDNGNFYIGDYGASVARLTVTPAGNVNIGTGSQFSVNSSGNIVSINSVPTNFPAAQGAVNTFLKNDGAGNLSWASGGNESSTASNGLNLSGFDIKLGGTLTTATNIAQAGQNLSFTGGNVGIGTTTPGMLLDIRGNSRIWSENVSTPVSLGLGRTSSDAELGVAGNFTDYSNFGNTGDIVLRANTANLILTARNGSGNICFGSGATDTRKMIMLNNGNFGIGNAAPSSLFSVGASEQFQVNSSGNIIKLNNLTTNFPSTQGSANTFLRNDGAGNLSWVTNAGESTTANNGLTLTGNNVQLGGNLVQNTTISQANFNQIFDLTGTGDFEVRKSGATDFIVDAATGNVGIGIAAPTSKLHLQDGNIKITHSGLGSVGIDGSGDGTQYSMLSLTALPSTNKWSLLHMVSGNQFMLQEYYLSSYKSRLSIIPGTGAVTISGGNSTSNDIHNSLDVVRYRYSGVGANGIGSLISIKMPNSAGTVLTAGALGSSFVNATSGSEVGSLFFQTYGTGSLSTKMTILGNGNTGISTTNPTQKLDVQDGNLLLSSTSVTPNELRFEEGTNTAGDHYTSFKAGDQSANINYTLPTAQGSSNTFLRNDGAGNLSWTSVAGDNLGNHTATTNIQLGNNFLSNDGGSEGISVSTDGNIGINIAANAADNLLINDLDNLQGGLRITAGTVTGTTTTDGLIMSINNTATNILSYEATPMNFGTSAATQMTLSSGGNLGIGISPTERLHVSGNSLITGSLSAGSDNFVVNSSGNITQINNVTTSFPAVQGGVNTFLRNDGAGNLTWVSNSSMDATTASNGLTKTGDDIRLGGTLIQNSSVAQAGFNFGFTGGNVGIGTTTPGALLEVAGQVKITGGTPGLNKVLTSDATGLATWQSLSALDATTASNGLTLTANDVKLGGTLIQNTTIAQAGFNIGFTGTGNVGIGTSTPLAKLHVVGNTAGTPIETRLVNYSTSTSDYPSLNLAHVNSATVGAFTATTINHGLGALEFTGSTGAALFTAADITTFATQNWTGTANGSAMYFRTTANGTNTPLDRMVIQQNGYIGIGTNTPTELIYGLAADADINMETNSNTESSSYHIMRSRGTVGSPTIVASGDYYGGMAFQAYNGASYQEGARIQGVVDGTPSLTSMPGKLEFWTTPAGTNTAVVNMTLKESGRLGIGITAPTSKVDIENTLDQVGLNVNQLYTGVGTKTSAVFTNTVDGTGTKYGIRNYTYGNAGSANNVYGTYNYTAPNGTGPGYCLYNYISPVGTGERYGMYTDVNTSATNTSATYGQYTIMDNDGSGGSYGLYINSIGSTTGAEYGLYVLGEDYNYFSGKVNIGTTILGTSKLAVEVPSTDVTYNSTITVNNNYTGASTKYGIDVNVDGGGSGSKYGISSSVVGLAGDASSNYGYQVAMTPNGTGVAYGIYSNVSAVGTGSRYGIRNIVSSAASNTANIYAIYNSMTNSGSGTAYGIYQSGEDYNYFSGRIGINTTTPGARLEVVGVNATTAIFNRTTSDGAVIAIEQDGVQEGSISVTGTTVSYNAFTGSHFAHTNENIEAGMLVSLTGENQFYHNKPTSEILHGVKKSAKANDAQIMGAYLGLLESQQKASVDNPHQVMAVGNGFMWVIDNGMDLKPGDYLISSNVEGHAMLDKAEFEVAHIIARVAEPVSWSNETQVINGVKHKKVAIFFENFDKNHKADRLEKEIQKLRTDFDELKSKIDLLISKVEN